MPEESSDMPPEKRLFVARMKQMIAERGLSQRRLAQLACVTSGSISDYLYGTRMPRAAELARLARALEVSMDWLWGEDESTDPAVKEETNSKMVELEASLHEISSKLKNLAKKADQIRGKGDAQEG